MAREAESEGIAPTTPAVLREEDVKALGMAWIQAPYLAPEFPTVLPGEYQAIEGAIRELRDWLRHTEKLQPVLVEASRRAELELEQARRADYLPDPGSLTVGELIEVLRVMEVAYASIGKSKIFFEQYHRREELLKASAGFEAFKRWANSVLGAYPTHDAAEQFLSRLARRIRGTFEEARKMRPLEAVRMLGEPEAAAGAPPVRSFPEPTAPSDPTEGDQTGPTAAGPGRTPPVDRQLADADAPETLAQQIRRRWPRKKLQAALIEYMSDRRAASYADVGDAVYGDSGTDGATIEQLVIRTNETLVELGASFYLHCGAEHVFKDPVES
jgi:hypothetical protein